MPPKRAMGVYSDYAPQMKQRRTWDTYSKTAPQAAPGTSSIASSAIESWYNTPSGYKPEAYDSGYYDTGDGSYQAGTAGMYQEQGGGGYAGKMGGGYGSDYTDAMTGYGNGVQSYGAESYGGSSSGRWTEDQSYSAPYNKMGRPGKKPAASGGGQANENAAFVHDLSLVSEAEKHYLQTRGQDTRSFLNTLKSAMNIVQSIEGKVGQVYMDEWDEGTEGDWGYDQNYPAGGHGGRGRGLGPRGRGRGGGMRRGGGWRGGQMVGQVFGQGTRGLFRGARGARGFVQGISAAGRGQMQGNKQRGRGNIRGGKPGFQNQNFQSLGRRGSHIAPVHSLATVQVKAGNSMLSLPEKIHRFCLFCINEADKVNEIQTIENALTASKLGLQSEYTVSYVGAKLFSGALFLDGVFIARAASSKKKQAKHDCYASALQVLRTQTVTQIMSLKDEGPEASVPSELAGTGSEEAMESDVESGPPGSCLPNSCVPGLHKLKQYLMARQMRATNTHSYVQEVEQAFSATNCGLSHNYEVDLVQTGDGKNMFRGRLYIEGILFAGAVNTQKKKTKQKVSEQAVNLIITQSVGVLVRGKTMKELEIDDTSLEVCAVPVTSDSTAVKVELSEEELLEKLIQGIKANIETKNCTNTLTKVASKLKIPITQIYHKIEQGNKSKEEEAGKSEEEGGKSMEEGGKSMEESGKSVEEAGNYIEEAGKSVEEAGKSVEEAGKSVEEAGKSVEEAGKSVEEAGKSVKEAGKSVECKLFVSGFLLATELGNSVQAARNEACRKAFEVLSESSADEIIANCHRITQNDTDDPTRFDPVPKNKKKKMDDSNLMRLKRIMNFDLEESLKINISEMIIMEHSDWSADRRRNAFCILSESALQNHMLLEWTVAKGDKLFTCTMSLQKIVLAEVSAINKASARFLAAGAILFRLYETLPVIMSASKSPADFWISSEELCEKAQELKEQSGETGSIEDDMIDLVAQTSNKDKPVNEHEKMETDTPSEITDKSNTESDDQTKNRNEGEQKKTVQYNKWITMYMEQLISEYVKTDVVDELMFGSGLSIGDLKRIAVLARKHGLKFTYRTFRGQTYSSINKRLSPRQVYILLSKGLPSKRYRIVPKSELPCYKDIQPEITEAGKVKQA